jgi:hypothetical protein
MRPEDNGDKEEKTKQMGQKKFAFINYDPEKCWIVKAMDQHRAIKIAVERGFAEDMKDFYYGLSDGQIGIFEVEESI